VCKAGQEEAPLEDPRISRMYAAMIGRGANRALGRFRKGTWLRSSVTWIVLLVMILFGVGVAVREKGRGRYTKLKSQLGAQPSIAVARPVQPGGEDPIVLSRAQQVGGVMPEFLSATLLPGRGMNVLQIMAYLPGKGEVPLLASPSLRDAADAMTGLEDDVNGQASLAMGGAIEVPWANRVSGAALPGGMSLLANWHGRGLTLAVNSTEGEIAKAQNAGGRDTGVQSAMGGLLLKRAADQAAKTVMPDGGLAEATFDTGSFDGHWPSKTEVKTTVLLSGRSLDLTILARNIGTEPEPMGIGWRPRFAIPSGDRAQTTLSLPSTVRTEMKDELPTGKLLPVEGTTYDFSNRNGTPLGSSSLNESFVHLKNGMLSSGPEIVFRNLASGYGMRMTVLSSSIKAIRVYAPADQPFILIDPQTNYDDPFGREWGKDEDPGLIVLEPGEGMQWKVRLELFQISGQHSGPS